MRKLLAVGAVAAGLVFVACGGGGGSTTPPTTGGTTAAATSNGGPVAIAPLKLVLDNKDGKVGLEVRADGSIVTGDGVLVASFDGRKLVGTESGKGIVIADDGTIQPLDGSKGDDTTLGFDAAGDIVSSDGHKIGVGADGSIVIMEAGKGSKPIPAHVVGVTPATHRLAALLVFVALMAHRHEAESSASVVAPPPTPPPPPAPVPIK